MLTIREHGWSPAYHGTFSSSSKTSPSFLCATADSISGEPSVGHRALPYDTSTIAWRAIPWASLVLLSTAKNPELGIVSRLREAGAAPPSQVATILELVTTSDCVEVGGFLEAWTEDYALAMIDHRRRLRCQSQGYEHFIQTIRAVQDVQIHWKRIQEYSNVRDHRSNHGEAWVTDSGGDLGDLGNCWEPESESNVKIERLRMVWS